MPEKASIVVLAGWKRIIAPSKEDSLTFYQHGRVRGGVLQLEGAEHRRQPQFGGRGIQNRGIHPRGRHDVGQADAQGTHLRGLGPKRVRVAAKQADLEPMLQHRRHPFPVAGGKLRVMKKVRGTSISTARSIR